MVEKRGASLWVSHVITIVGVLIVFFPIWLAFVASTVTQPEITNPPMPLWPGDQFFNNYRDALVSGVNVPVATMLFNSLIMAIGIAGFGMLNSYGGLILPLIASATATFLFRQFYMTVPDELAGHCRHFNAKTLYPRARGQ